MPNRPIFLSARAVALLLLFAVPAAAANPPHPTLTEAGRKEVTRMMADRSTPSVLPPNYPQKFRPPMPQTKEGWRAAYITLGALGGMAAGAATGAVAGCIRHRGEDCGFFGGLAGAPIGATAAGVTVALLTR